MTFRESDSVPFITTKTSHSFSRLQQLECSALISHLPLEPRESHEYLIYRLEYSPLPPTPLMSKDPSHCNFSVNPQIWSFRAQIETRTRNT